MSWLNNSLNTIKGQLTNLAQEVLADTAGPGDDEYRGPELRAKTTVELLNETQLLKQLEKTCDDKDREINALRKQITTLTTQKSNKVTSDEADGDGKSALDVGNAPGQDSGAKSLRSAEDQNVEDSWCWEPAAARGPTEAGMLDVALVDGTDTATDVPKLKAIIVNLEQNNEELRSSLDMLDAQHEQAMQNMFSQKTQLQDQLQELKQQQADRLVAHELEMGRLKAQLAEEQRQQQAAAAAQQQLEQRVEQQDIELQRCLLELAEMQQLLEKRGADNGELIERVRQADDEREKLQRELDELVKQTKEKKTSESSNSSSTDKHSEDEFIVVRNADAAGSSSDPDAEATTPPTKEKLRDKLVALEARIAELGAANAKLQDVELERQLAETGRQEQLSELETRLRISESEKEELQLQLQRKLQQLMLQNQELKLNAEADQETHANDLEQQLGTLRDENCQLRQELDASIAQAKFRQAIAEEKITDLDLDQDQEQDRNRDQVDRSGAKDQHKLRSLLEALVAEKSDLALERTLRLLSERWQRLETIERRLIEMQDQQQLVQHEKRTLEADISQYILQCDELMKNNELLLNELDKLKRNKLETIEEHHEETIAQLEGQLEEAQAQLRRQSHANQAQLDQLNAELAQQAHELTTKQNELDTLATSGDLMRQQLHGLQMRETQLVSQLEQLEDLQSQGARARHQLHEQLEAKQVQLAELLQAQQAESASLRVKLEEKQQWLLDAVRCKEQLKSQLEELKIQLQEQQEAVGESATLKQLLEQLLAKYEQLKAQLDKSAQHSVQLKQQLEELQLKELHSQSQQASIEATLAAGEQQLETLRAQLAAETATIETLNGEKLELIKALQQKHAENTQYYTDIQRLEAKEQQLGELIAEREKLCDQISFLKEKSDILTTNLLTEQTNQRLLHQQQTEAQDQNANVQRDLERLRAHLVEIEELHTQETVELQRELDEARAKQTALQQEVSKSSTAYTSASIRANQQAETLQAQHALLLQQRDELLSKLGQFEDREQKQQVALTNLQCALEQFQNDKEHDIVMATQRMRREMLAREELQAQLLAEIGALQQQLADANQGLRAATRLSDQLEAGQQTIAVLRDEVDSLKDANVKLEQSLSSSESSQTDKIDKSLIKSLLIGYVVSGHAGDKQQVLRMISSVLDFNVQEADKVGLNKPQSSWLGNILGGGSSVTSNTSAGNDNLLQAFVQFLEQESQPQSTAQSRPNLLSMAKQLEAKGTPAAAASAAADADANAAAGGVAAAGGAPAASVGSSIATANTTATAPAIGGEQLPHATPATSLQSLHMSNNEFAPTRNSSSILKDILNDS